MIASRHHHMRQARTGHVAAARQHLARAPKATAPAMWQKAAVSGRCGAVPTFLGIDDATARRPMEASP
jgi:hypothetical protein